MRANYGYQDGSGAYFIAVETEQCDGCGQCVLACPYGVLEIAPNEFDPLTEGSIAAVALEHRKKIKYSCAPCKPVRGSNTLPCVHACPTGALAHSW